MAEKTKAKKTSAPEKTAKKREARERKPSALRRDHLKVIAALAADLPKRTALSMKDIAKAKFKDGSKITADRIARNSVRKPRQMGLVEICERGEYRLTPTGAAFAKGLDKYETAPDMQREAKAPSKAAAKKAAKPEKAAKTAAPKKAAKKGAGKAAKPAKTAKPVNSAKKVRKTDPDFPDDPEEKSVSDSMPVDTAEEDAAVADA
jgi:hypothetical protein